MDNSFEVKVGAYEAGSWNGIVLITDDRASFQVRVGVQAEFGDYIDGDISTEYRLVQRETVSRYKWQSGTKFRDAPFFYSVQDVGAHAPDQSYCLLKWNPLYPYDTGSSVTLEWCRSDEQTVIGRVSYHGAGTSKDYNRATRSANIVLEANSPWFDPARFAINNGAIEADANYRPSIGEIQWDNWRFRHSSSNAATTRQKEEGFLAGSQNSDFQDGDWRTVRSGSYWQEDPWVTDEGGYGWYRQSFVIPDTWKGHDLVVDLGSVRETELSFMNGSMLEDPVRSDTSHTYTIVRTDKAYSQIRWGDVNTLAVQVHSQDPPGGLSRGDVVEGAIKEYVRRPRITALADTWRSMFFVVVGDNTLTSAGSFQNLENLQKQMEFNGSLDSDGGDQVAGLHYGHICPENKTHSANNVVRFIAKVGTNRDQTQSQARAMLDPILIDEVLRRNAEKYDRNRVKVDGAYPQAAEMIANTVEWAALYGPEQGKVFAVDTRSWTYPHRWVLFANSAVLTAWACGLENKRLAQDTLRAVMAGQLADGRIMNAAGPWGETPDRSEDMYDAYVAWKLYLKWGDKDFLRDIYPPIKAWNRWWFNDRGDGQPWRDGNRDGLLSLGSNISPFDTPQEPFDSERYGLHHQSAMLESGYDDSPMWGYYERGGGWVPPSDQYKGEERVRYVFQSGTFNLDDVETNCLYALDTEVLSLIAAELGYAEDAQMFRREYGRIKERINSYLWDDATGMYLNRLWPEHGGEFSYVKTPVMFYALAAGVASEDQARRLVEDHLLNTNEFWGPYVLPTVSRDDPCFAQQTYWRGSIWPPMNFFAYEGLKRYGFDEAAAELAEKTYALVKTLWDEDGALYENYHSTDGKPHSSSEPSTRHYSWSACLPLILIMECIDQDAWTGLRFGSIGLENAVARNITIAGHIYDVHVGGPTVLQRDEEEIFLADGPVVVRGFRMTDVECRFVIKTKSDSGAVSVTVSNPAMTKPLCVMDSLQLSSVTVENGAVHLNVPSGEHELTISY